MKEHTPFMLKWTAINVLTYEQSESWVAICKMQLKIFSITNISALYHPHPPTSTLPYLSYLKVPTYDIYLWHHLTIFDSVSSWHVQQCFRTPTMSLEYQLVWYFKKYFSYDRVNWTIGDVIFECVPRASLGWFQLKKNLKSFLFLEKYKVIFFLNTNGEWEKDFFPKFINN